MKKEVVIIRGTSGIGKSTFAKNNYPNALILSADDFFMKNGEYLFDPKMLSKAHQDCFYRYMNACSDENVGTIVVDNTFTELWECRNYISLANKIDIPVKVFELVPADLATVKKILGRNIHNVPPEVVLMRIFNFQKYEFGIPEIGEAYEVEQIMVKL